MIDSDQHFPPELSSFVGRAEELATLIAALAPGRVLSLVGPGGCGKTRLALRACAAVADSWPDGIRWIGLADERAADGVVRAIASALGIPLAAAGFEPAESDGRLPVSGGLPPESSESQATVADPVRMVARELMSKTMLLVLDNCEHLRDPVVRILAAILARGPGVGVLATSRVALDLPGERVHRISALNLADALELFLERAGGAEPGRDALAAARRVCDRLDRLPLALELAAGWAGTLSLAQLADALRDPFALLDDDTGRAPYRQATLTASMRWSYDLLDADERELFRRLGVFEPGFAARAVTGLAERLGVAAGRYLRALRGLIGKSLVSADTTGAVARYRMLGVVRDYALLRLDEAGETAELRDLHLDLMLVLVEEAAPMLDSDKDAWRTQLTVEYPNLRAAIEWGLHRSDSGNPSAASGGLPTAMSRNIQAVGSASDPTAGRRLAASVAWLWHLGMHAADGIRLLERAAAQNNGSRDETQARVLLAQALVADTALPGFVSYEKACAAAELADDLGLADVGSLARVLIAIGAIGFDLDRARAEAAAVHADAIRAGDGFVVDATQALIGLVHLLRDEHRDAIDQLEPAVSGLLRRGDRAIGSSALCWLALATAQSGALPRAIELAEQAVTTAAPLRDFHRIALARAALAEILLWAGRSEAAAAALAPLDRLVDGAETAPFVPGWERVHALLALDSGRPTDAMIWCRREGRWQQRPSDDQLTPWTRLVLARAHRESGAESEAAALLDQLSAAPLTTLLPSVRAAVLEQRALLAPDTEQEMRMHHEALRIRDEHGLVLACADSLAALAAVALRRSSFETAGLLFGAADRVRADAGSVVRVAIPDEPQLLEYLERGRAMSLREAIDFITRARGKRNRPDSGWESLTPTERSVVELAVSGLTNPEIAARLFISRGTVKTHLAHVYAKLGIANRTELARRAPSDSSNQLLR
ncbi:helix-turn-helix transcriptional regulator [Nocardia vinacea]|uniref:helix-turn-helix transcriptional regulator n=1 Tax=Nocardia vinacea TaxID=96468 RepID=UPI00146CB8E0|nr:LuxR C-terminal-related transcriptional regulator [Nocardia vinacea]